MLHIFLMNVLVVRGFISSVASASRTSGLLMGACGAAASMYSDSKMLFSNILLVIPSLYLLGSLWFAV